MFAIAYASKSNRIFSELELADLAAKAAEKNDSLRITGYLNFKNGTFFQYLEGAEAAVRSLMTEIADDDRHTIVNVVELGEVGQRRFKGWSMRYLTPYDMSSIRMEDVLENVLVSMSDKTFGHEKVRNTVIRIVDKIATARPSLPLRAP
jgi:hypothetical protein